MNHRAPVSRAPITKAAKAMQTTVGVSRTYSTAEGTYTILLDRYMLVHVNTSYMLVHVNTSYMLTYVSTSYVMLMYEHT